MRIQNRTFIISGGSSGLGLATAQELLRAGGYISIFDIAEPPVASAEDSSRILFIKADVTDVSSLEHAVEETVLWTHRTGASLGGVINGAGIGKPELIIDRKGQPHSATNWDRTMSVNLSGTFHLTRLAVKHLVKVPREEGPDGERGVIFMISSTVAYEGLPGQVAYAASKGALRSMTLPMARDLAKYGIRVVTIAAAPFSTPMTSHFDERTLKSIQGSGLLYPKRFGSPSEFSGTVKWVLECPFVNGETIKMTGGARMSML